MPNKKGKGGKKAKRGKHENVSKREMIFKEESGQAYAIIEKMLGNGRVYLSYFMNDEEDNMRKYDALGIIRGSMKKRVWISPNDIVLISIRDFEKEKVDILHKYENDEVHTLVNIKEIPNNIFRINSNEDTSDNTIINSEPDEVLFTDEVEFISDEEI